ncbi:MAG: glycogen debranching protein GlgX [Candidatus Thermoplasmatota archaeon]|nr:glycogen debranching protein GlgX [Candidatus Thermoplasmatota archaeon]
MFRPMSGEPYPLGATLLSDGVNFSLFSENATSVTLELYRNSYDKDPYETIEMEEKTNFVWHSFISGLGKNALYAYRVDGPYEPEQGHRFNKNKMLLDPYAKAISGTVRWNNSIFSYNMDNDAKDLSMNSDDDAGFLPKCIVIDPTFDWKEVDHPRNPWRDTIIYETHVKGLTYRRNDIPDNLRGTYLGLSSKPMLDYFHDLGITAIELMPIHQRIDNMFLVDRGLSNYWGYNTIAYFAPDVRFSSSEEVGEQVKEFKSMVRTLHDNGLEVILDVVYNHTAEGNHLGPTISFRGIDNSVYYRLSPENRRYYVDYTGTGNSLNAGHPQVLQLIMDSLRYWITEMHVDGFRFDLASTLARQLHEVDSLSAFFDIIHQDPVISRVKLIAEPWDVGPGGYQVGNFPIKWAEWNGKYRDSVRRFWRGENSLIGEFAQRLSGSPDLYEESGRKPHASINYVCSHDGFTMMDLVSYVQKHNEANGENNQDGTNENYSSNFGVEGPSNDPVVTRRRIRRIKNFFLTLLVSQGAPMILGGDEIGRTQRGNNNAYCQDNEISWYDWNLDHTKTEIHSFVKRVISIRKEIAALRRHDFFSGSYIDGKTPDVLWFRQDGKPMTLQDWQNPITKSLGVFISGKLVFPYGRIENSPSCILIFNASEIDLKFQISSFPGKWITALGTEKDVAAYPEDVSGDYVMAKSGSSMILVSSISGN